MPDDLEDVSAVETVETTPSAEPTPAPVDVPVETSSEPVHADEQVFTTSTRIGTAEDANRQQVAAENGAIHGNGDVDGRTVTEAGRQAKAADQEEKKEAFSRAQEHAEALRKEWMERDHDFGGIKMSGHDLAKMIDFISNPQMQDKLRERLGKSGMPKEKIDKGMKELNEYIELKKKEQEGQKLTEEQQRRLKELEKSDEFKAVAAAAAQQARDNGIELSGNRTKEAITAVVTDKASLSSEISNQLQEGRSNFNSEASNAEEFEREGAGKSAAYAHFTNAPHLSDEFTSKVAITKPAPIANDVNNGFDTTTPAAVVAQAQVKPKTIDVSFG